MNVILGILAFLLALFCGYYGTLIWEEELSQSDESVEAFQESEEYAGLQGDYIAPQNNVLPEVVDKQPTQPQPLPEPSVYAETQAPVVEQVPAPVQAQNLEQDILPEPQEMVAPVEQKNAQSSYKKYDEDSSKSLLNSITNLMGDPKQAKTSSSPSEEKPSTSKKEASAKPNDSRDSLLNSINNLMK